MNMGWGIMCRWLLICGVVFLATATQAADNYQRLREQMVREHIVSAGIKNRRVLDAMRSTPRHELLPLDQRDKAYYDMAIPIGHGQTMSPPYIVAYMTEQLDPQPEHRVLEIGTGSGYQAAVLSPLVADVYSIEIVAPLGEEAARNLQRLGYQNVHTKVGDGYLGWAEHAPFDRIIVTCSPENIPQPLVEQLAEGGMLVIPVGERFQQTLYRFTKRNGKLEKEALQGTFFVPMTGESESQRQVLPDNSKPVLAHGSFEEVLENSTDPDGWYYVRQARVQPEEKAPDGQHVLEFSNKVVGRSSHVLQSFGVDGSKVGRLEIRLWVQATRVRSGKQQDQAARALVEFYGADRAPVGSAYLGPWTGSFRWEEQTKLIDVPPNAQLAVFAVGLFGATGSLQIDKVSLQAR